MFFSGGIVSLSFDPNDSNANMNKLPIANTYNTKELGPDDYFGKISNSLKKK